MANDDSEHKRNRYRPYLEQTYKDLHQRLFSYARKLANGRLHDAEDLVQETFCRALIYPRNPEEISNPLGYLLRTMRNAWRDKWAKENTAVTDSLDELLNSARPHAAEPAMEPDVQRILENEELMAEMKVKQGPLTGREKLLLKLHLEGFRCNEIAARLNEDVRLIRSDLNAVRAKVRYRIRK